MQLTFVNPHTFIAQKENSCIILWVGKEDNSTTGLTED